MKKMLTVLSMVLFTIGCDNTFLDLSQECVSDADCADGDPCTVDICGIDRTCVMVPSDNPACEPPSDCVPTDCVFECQAEGMSTGVCSGDMCVCLPTTECETSADCDDGDDCTVDLCEVGGICRHVPSDDPACAPPECVTSDDCGFRDSECIISRCVMNHCLLVGRDDDVDGHQLCGSSPGEYYDCDDHNPAVHPGVGEICDGLDNDCDGETDADAIDRFPIYFDRDGDGFGFDTPTATSSHCPTEDMPPGYVTNAEDCDDSDAAINPDAQELCDEIDNDCDGETDEDYREDLGRTCVIFSDEGLCTEFGVITCNAPGEMFQLACDSSPPGTIWSIPGSIDTCGNGLDDNCDGLVDEDCP